MQRKNAIRPSAKPKQSEQLIHWHWSHTHTQTPTQNNTKRREQFQMTLVCVLLSLSPSLCVIEPLGQSTYNTNEEITNVFSAINEEK